MRALPAAHVPRPRLVEVLAAARIGLVEAPGGFGKSVLAAELGERLDVPWLEADVQDRIASAPLLIAAVRAGALRAGLSNLALALEGGTDGAALIDALAAAPHPVLLVVDEAQEIEGEADAALAELVAGAPRTVRVLVLGRRIPEAVARAAPADAARLDAARLTFARDEVGALLRSALGEEPGTLEEAEVARAAQGWPALAALAAARLAREPAATRTHLAAARRTFGLLVDDALADLDPAARATAAQLAHLPLLAPGLIDEAVGDGAFDHLVRAGLPLAPRRDGWYELPGRVREELAGRGPLDPALARAAAQAYADHGELATALQLLARSRQHETIAEVVATRPLAEVDEVGLPVLLATVATLPDETLRQHPRALLQLARVAELARARPDLADLLARADALVEAAGPVRRELDAERALAAFRRNDFDAIGPLAESALTGAGPDEALTRARARAAQALLATERHEPSEHLFEEAAALFATLGEGRWRGDALAGLAYYDRFRRGYVEAAGATMDEALASLSGPSRDRAAWLTFRAEIATYAGHLPEAEAALREAEAIGRALGDARIISFAAWSGALVAARRGDVAVVQQRLAAAEREGARWLPTANGLLFFADAALVMARLGEADAALAYLERAETVGRSIGAASAALWPRGVWEARYGDSAQAERTLVDYAQDPARQMAPRDEWRLLLERAGAAQRAGDPEGAGALAARAFEAARALGLEDLVPQLEPDLSASLRPLAAAAGSRAASEVGERDPALSLELLGGFSVSSDGRRADPPPGHPTTLVKLLGLARAPVPLDAAAEALWPGVSSEVGRRRLRNVLNRIRASSGELVVRDGDALALEPRVEVDVRLFTRDAVAALAAGGDERPALARAALASYRGELLPADRYAPWADAHREELRRRVLDLLDLLVEDARDRGAMDDAIRLLERAIEVEPNDEARYLTCAELLLAHGRRGSARDLVTRARGLRDSMGLPPSPRLERLASATRAAIARTA